MQWNRKIANVPWAMGRIALEEEHDFMMSKGVVEHSIETEIEDALIFGEMRKYFQIE